MFSPFSTKAHAGVFLYFHRFYHTLGLFWSFILGWMFLVLYVYAGLFTNFALAPNNYTEYIGFCQIKWEYVFRLSFYGPLCWSFYLCTFHAFGLTTKMCRELLTRQVCEEFCVKQGHCFFALFCRCLYHQARQGTQYLFPTKSIFDHTLQFSDR